MPGGVGGRSRKASSYPDQGQRPWTTSSQIRGKRHIPGLQLSIKLTTTRPGAMPQAFALSRLWRLVASDRPKCLNRVGGIRETNHETRRADCTAGKKDSSQGLRSRLHREVP